jgi:hypothetical protein
VADLEAVLSYLEDMDVASCNAEEHVIHLRQLFTRLREHGLVINVKKCVFGASSIQSWATTSRLKGWSHSQRTCRR